jgi:hypothetical protein
MDYEDLTKFYVIEIKTFSLFCAGTGLSKKKGKKWGENFVSY